MPVATATLLSTVLPAVIAGVAGAGGGVLAQKSKNAHEKEMETINQTDPGFTDLGSSMAGKPPPRFSLNRRQSIPQLR